MTRLTKLMLLSQMQEDTWITSRALAEKMNLSSNRVSQALAELANRGAILRRPLPIRGRAEIYEFCKPPASRCIPETVIATIATPGIRLCRDCCEPLKHNNNSLGRYCAKCFYRRVKAKETPEKRLKAAAYMKEYRRKNPRKNPAKPSEESKQRARRRDQLETVFAGEKYVKILLSRREIPTTPEFVEIETIRLELLRAIRN